MSILVNLGIFSLEWVLMKTGEIVKMTLYGVTRKNVMDYSRCCQVKYSVFPNSSNIS